MQLVLAQMDLLMNQLNRRIEGSSSDMDPKDIVDLSNEIARDYLRETVLVGKEAEIADKISQRYFHAKLDECLKQYESSLKANSPPIRTSELKRLNLSPCFQKYGPFAKDWSFQGAIE